MDVIRYKIREDGRILNCAAYVVLGGILEGNKDIFSITIDTNESSKFWLGILNDLKKCGVQYVCSSVWMGFQCYMKQLKLFIQ